MNTYLAPTQTDANGNPPPPVHFKVSIHDSSVILPRSSIGVDMVGLDVKLLTLFNTFHHESFSIPNGEQNLDKREAISFHEVPQTKNMDYTFFSHASAFSSQQFFECRQSNDDGIRESAFTKKSVRRINVQILLGTRIFASTSPNKMAPLTTL